MTEGEPPPGKAARYAYRLLAVRPVSEKEFRSKLRGKGFGSAEVEAVAARFKELGYLNDESLAKQLARALAVNRLWGDYRIARTLKEKGIPEDFIGGALALAREEITERAAVIQLLGKKGRGGKIHLEDNKEKRRYIQSLMGKGFPSGLIFELLSMSGEEEVHEGE